MKYSPFFDGKGRPLSIEKIKYCHLEQLKDCDEGHHLEYKRLLEDNEKAQLAKEIASFANCEGGWLIVGIDDKTKAFQPIEKKDYSQKIGKIATRISPMPEFNTRFITMPDDKKRGILLIYVYEGRNAPYICNGSIYVRSGSSKEPVKSADRGNVEYLYEKSNGYKKEIEEFCKRDYFLPYDKRFQQKAMYPIANVYLKNISSKKNNFLNTYANRDEFIDFVKANNMIFEHISYSMDSIIFMHKFIPPGSDGVTLVMEVFYDWSCKITLPIGLSVDESKDTYLDIFRELGMEEKVLEKIQLVGGPSVFNGIISGLHLFKTIAKQYKLKEKDYACCIEVENAGGTVIAFPGAEYKTYVSKYGIPYAHKENNKGRLFFLKDYPKMDFNSAAYSLIADDLGAIFGFRSDSIFKLLQNANHELYRDTENTE